MSYEPKVTSSYTPNSINESISGIVSIGTYIPRTRLKRSSIAAANKWANPNLVAKGKGYRAICAHDEDSLTMAVSASQNATLDTNTVDQLLFASTTMPFSDRQNSTVICEALSLKEDIKCSDFTGSLRCGTSALINALGASNSTLVVASDKRKTHPASTLEMVIGDGAASILTGTENLLARFIGSHSISIDFTDHYRAQGSEFDYQLEERWIRDEGHLKIIPAAITSFLEKNNIDSKTIDHLVIANVDQRTINGISEICSIPSTSIINNLNLQCGDTGSPHAFLMLAHALENSKPNELILMAGFGQGSDILLFETTDRVLDLHISKPLQNQIENGVEDDNYLRYLSFNNLIALDWGMRSERDNRTSQSAFYRHRKTVTSFIGGRCESCNTVQFPKKTMCANPECRLSGTQVDEHFKDKKASVKSFTEDWLALCYNPPFKYGNVRFEGGGIVMMEFSDFSPGEISVGTQVSMQFRIKEEDHKRHFKRYFWKATPAA